ncbi:OmpA family protein [Hymenobacter chitinivorans]|uniref:Outer membrane protein OmpA-like peptidoglycan-associated protein n=1 Tax=Hymenobacter chitinivorans DSM 11115 TaxID=1121954 RepID=A0A2M9ASK7_9BACT|nr:OmpA family protein [Hymenobacter chitinivorans]PJJ48690.1 outer membrane protein OmpA-like peptidoglycan-associated protein [Hymenobacter chitinivorans DSM 11115]
MKKHILSVVALIALLTACDNLKNPETKDQPQEATADTAVVYRDGKTAGDAVEGAANAAGNAADAAGNAVSSGWDMTKAKLADVKYPEVNLPDVTVRGNDEYSVYGVEETVLFDTDKAEIKAGASKALEQISASIGQRYATGPVYIMGFADSRGDKSYNRELSEKRANAVKTWLSQNGKIDASRVSIEPMGESQPVASNATAEGRQQNRRVEIAVRTK